MNFELLANETILDLFEYIPLYDLFHGFFNLNSRFNQLLCVQFQKFHLDFQLLSKTKCIHMCENYIPLVIDRIISLHLSNDDHTPQVIELFLSQRFQLLQLTHLQSITISFIQSKEILDQIMIECYHLPCLTRLSFTDSDLRISRNDADHFYNQIWSLKHLTYCHLNISSEYEGYFPNSSVISTSLRHLLVENLTCSLSRLGQLCHDSPNLKYLSTNFNNSHLQFNSLLRIESISQLNIPFTGSIYVVQTLLENLPNLSHLTCEAVKFYTNGYQWEELIREYLPKLRIFRFKMDFLQFSYRDKEFELNKIIDTYRTKFWIEEHRWFVQCDWFGTENQDGLNQIYLFTLPYSFRDFYNKENCILSKSTSPFNEEYLVCDNVKHLNYDSSSFMSPISSHVRFNNLTSLSLSLPFNDQFLSIVPKLDRLVSLRVTVEKDENLDKIESQLQLLLNQAVHLLSISFDDQLVPPMEITSVSVRILNLTPGNYFSQPRLYDEHACVQLYRSYLGKQCETLSIKVKNRRNMFDLVNNMPHLQSLTVECDDWSEEHNSVSSVGNNLMEWLRNCIPFGAMARYESMRTIGVWIR